MLANLPSIGGIFQTRDFPLPPMQPSPKSLSDPSSYRKCTIIANHHYNTLTGSGHLGTPKYTGVVFIDLPQMDHACAPASYPDAGGEKDPRRTP